MKWVVLVFLWLAQLAAPDNLRILVLFLVSAIAALGIGLDMRLGRLEKGAAQDPKKGA